MSPLHTSSFTVCSSSHHPSFQSHVHLCIALHFISVFPGYEKRGKSYFFLPFFIIYITSSRLSLSLSFYVWTVLLLLCLCLTIRTVRTPPVFVCMIDIYPCRSLPFPLTFSSLLSFTHFTCTFFRHSFYLVFCCEVFFFLFSSTQFSVPCLFIYSSLNMRFFATSLATLFF